MKYSLYLLFSISIVLICFVLFHDRTNVADVKQYVTIKDVSVVHEGEVFFIEVESTTDWEHDIEITEGSDAGVELTLLPALHLNNEFVGITNRADPICFPAKSSVKRKFMLDRNKRHPFHSGSPIDFSYGIQTWRSRGQKLDHSGKMFLVCI